MGETFQYFKAETSLQLMMELQGFQTRAKMLSTLIKGAEQTYRMMNISTIQAFNNRDRNLGWTDEFAAQRQRLLDARQALGLSQMYIKGYELLNEIGHWFNNREGWQYSVTLFGRENITFHLTQDEFLSISEAHLSGFKLMSKTSILAQLKDVTDEKKRINWNDEKNKDTHYNKKLFDSYKRSIRHAYSVLTNGGAGGEKYADYNEGQILEGYMAYTEKEQKSHLAVLAQLANVDNLSVNAHLGSHNFNMMKSLYDQLKQQTNSRGFWTGGDTAIEGQIKGEGAGVFKYETITNQLDKFVNIINQINFSKLEKAVEQIKPKARSSLANKTKQILDEVMAQFNAITANAGSLYHINQLSQDIDAVIDRML